MNCRHTAYLHSHSELSDELPLIILGAGSYFASCIQNQPYYKLLNIHVLTVFVRLWGLGKSIVNSPLHLKDEWATFVASADDGV